MSDIKVKASDVIAVFALLRKQKPKRFTTLEKLRSPEGMLSKALQRKETALTRLAHFRLTLTAKCMPSVNAAARFRAVFGRGS